jgi:hypothetical protein
LFGLAIARADRNVVCDATISDTIPDETEPESDPEAPPTEEVEDPEEVGIEVSGIIVDDAASDNRIEDSRVTGSGNWDVFVSTGAVDNPFTNLSLDSTTVSLDGRDFAVRAVDDPPADPEDLTNVGGYVAAADRGENPVLGVDVHYDDADAGAVDEETLRLYEFVQEWNELPDSAVDTATNVVSGTIAEFDPDGRVFGPFGDS